MELKMRNLYRYCFLICLVTLAGLKPALAQVCPCTIWASSAAPAVVDGGDSASVEIGVKFRADVAGFVTGIRFYKGTANTGTHIGHLWNGSGTLLGTGTFSGETSTGWQQVNFTAPVAVSANVTYVASYFAPNGHYSFDQNIFTSAGVDSPPLHALAAGVDGPNGVYAYGSTSAFPASTFNSSNYWVDAVFSMTSAPAGPTVTSFTPANGSATASVTTAVTATFAGSVDATTVSSSTFQLHDSLNNLVGASVTYDGPSRTATLQPTAPLTAATNYTAVVVGGAATSTVKDLSGVSMAASVTWSFATAPAPGGCPCTIWPVTTTPAVVDGGDGVGVELGVRFRTDISGYIYGIRFYRSTANAGTHQGSLWTNTGTLLATATFTGETASGWQQVNFSSPVAVTSGTTYVASYYTTTGHYSVDAGFFTSSGADAPPLHALPDNLDGNDGVYSYGPVSAFPVSTFGAANYWVDVVFDTASPAPTVTAFSPANGAASVNTATAITATFSTAIDPATLSAATFTLLDGVGNTVPTSLSYNPATFTATAQPSAALAAATSYTASLPAGGVKTPSGAGLAAGVTWSFMTASASAPPSVLSFSPPAGASGVATTTGVTATFSKAMDPTTINGTSFQLLGPGNTVVSAVLSYNSSNLTATLQPSSALSPLTSYTAIVRGGLVKDTQGNALPGTVSWSFTTVTGPPPPPTNCPCTLWSAATTPDTVDSADPAGVEVGVKFRTDAAGLVTGLRFYKSALNLGTHVGNLWSSAGTLMASVTFTNESASGWQQVNFASPVAVTANTVYVASYFAPQGHYSVTANAFTNLGVDNPPLHALANGVSGSNGVYTYGTSSAFPSSSFNSGNYWVDVVFVLNNSTNPPTVLSVAPAAGSSGASVGMAISASFNEPMNPATINTAAFQLVDVSNNVISGTVSYDSPSASIVFTPSGGLLSQTTYTATVNTSVKDTFGNALAQSFQWSFTTAPPPANTGPGGPILVISSSQNPYTRYLGEILLNEGLNEFTVQDISTVTAATLATYDIAILGDMTLAPSQVSMLTSWVTGGGKLIAMHPDKQLAGLLGLASTPNTLSNQYLAVNTLSGPGVGIVPDSIQFHGPADLYTLSGATAYATLYSSVTTPTSAPAVTWINTGAGQAAAFVYDLARSVVWTRQGNPAWSGQQRNGFIDPTSGQSFFQIRSDDLYYGNSSSDPEPDWVNLDKVQIPQADEQQRLLVNLIEQMNASTRPLPRFWYLPSGFKAAVLMTGDDHGNGGTSGRFDQYIAASPANCSVADWACVRGTSYVWPYTSIPNYVTYISKGFEIANHADNAPTCTNWTPASLTTAMTNQLTGDSGFASYFPQAPAPRTNRTHCVLWSDYDSEPQIELSFGIRLDTTYYYWPQGWIQDRPGMFTGSGMPMRFADRNGNTIDVYQATTQMPDESLQTFPFTIDTLLDNAVGPKGFYGVFTANMHTDYVQSDGSDAIVASAQTHGVPVVTALQMLTWLDGRNNSSFGSISWSSNVLSFTVTAATGSRNLMAMVPATAPGVMLQTLKLNGTNVSFTQQTIKGIQYASFSASTGSYQATYAPVFSVSGTITGPGASGATVSVTGTATASTTASSTGQYTITNLFAGSYTVTPFKSGFTFTPANQAVTVNANVTGVNFSSIVTPTFSISGTVSGAGGSAAVLTLSGAGSATTVANASGVYTLTGVPAGSYTVTPAKSGYLFTPTSTNVTVSAASISGINFTSTAATTTTLAMDANVSADLGTTNTGITSPALSTKVGNELLLAFIAADNFGTGDPTSVTSVTGGGLTWVLVQQTNAQLGTSEIWRAFAPAPLTNVAVTANFNDDVPESSITVVTFTGVDFSGTNGSGAIGAVGTGNAANGAPTASLVTTRPNSWVFGVGNDYDNAIARTPASGQTLVHQYLGPADSTYWVQRQNSTTSTKGTTVRINDTSPSSDRYNLSTVEILAIQPPIASLSPSSVPFGIQVVNTTSNPSVVTLTNSGNGILLINSITIAGTNATDFAKTTTCGSSLAVGANCTISLTFRPGATGSRTGTLSITDNAAGESAQCDHDRHGNRRHSYAHQPRVWKSECGYDQRGANCCAEERRHRNSDFDCGIADWD